MPELASFLKLTISRPVAEVKSSRPHPAGAHGRNHVRSRHRLPTRSFYHLHVRPERTEETELHETTTRQHGSRNGERPSSVRTEYSFCSPPPTHPLQAAGTARPPIPSPHAAHPVPTHRKSYTAHPNPPDQRQHTSPVPTAPLPPLANISLPTQLPNPDHNRTAGTHTAPRHARHPQPPAPFRSMHVNLTAWAWGEQGTGGLSPLVPDSAHSCRLRRLALTDCLGPGSAGEASGAYH